MSGPGPSSSLTFTPSQKRKASAAVVCEMKGTLRHIAIERMFLKREMGLCLCGHRSFPGNSLKGRENRELSIVSQVNEISASMVMWECFRKKYAALNTHSPLCLLARSCSRAFFVLVIKCFLTDIKMCAGQYCFPTCQPTVWECSALPESLT